MFLNGLFEAGDFLIPGVVEAIRPEISGAVAQALEPGDPRSLSSAAKIGLAIDQLRIGADRAGVGRCGEGRTWLLREEAGGVAGLLGDEDGGLGVVGHHLKVLMGRNSKQAR